MRRISRRKLMTILSIDAGTTGVTALIVSESGEILARGYCEFGQYFPKPGWVEHEPEEIWQAVLKACEKVLGQGHRAPSCIGITNQRETAVVWNRETLKSPTRAIVWQDRRTSDMNSELQKLNLGDWIRKRTGLNIDPYFTSSKFLWWKRNLPKVWEGVESGELALGTVDSYLAARISNGGLHITDASNASRTQLMALDTCEWDPKLLEVFGVPLEALPKIVSSWGQLGFSEPSAFLGLHLPITGIAGDQQAALFGQTGFQKGDSKATYGTGAFILSNTGSEIFHSSHGLLSTVAWLSPKGEKTYALEGSVFVAGAAVQWLRDGLKIIEDAAGVEKLAKSVTGSQGVYFVPALTGLGAPFWNADIRGSLMGITRGTTDANIAYATLEAIAFQINSVVTAMALDSGRPIQSLWVDGGAAANDLLLQIQADVLKSEVVRAEKLESTGLGAALLAGLGMGIWKSLRDLKNLNPPKTKFKPKTDRQQGFETWERAVLATSSFREN
jgi:glycerol kinase